MKGSDICPVCHGDEWVLIKHSDGTEEAVPCECRQKSIIKRRLSFADIPEAFKDHELKSFRIDVYKSQESKAVVSVACKTIKTYLDNFVTFQDQGMGLYIYSNTKGSGKTRIAASIANELVNKRDKMVKFAVSTTILNEIKRTWDRDSEYTENRLLDHLTTTDVLVIDDFGTEKVTGWVTDKFYHIINQRYINRKVTIFTSNESLETLKYDSRIISRIKERTYQIRFPEESVRDHIAEANNKDMLDKICG